MRSLNPEAWSSFDSDPTALLEVSVATLQRELYSRGGIRAVGVSSAWKENLRAAARVAPSDTTVLITGETGTGKEVISRIIHHGSRRSKKPFVAINCAALPEQLLESELFGHERGAFTGAIATRIGRIEQAAGGTLFLDEIAEMSPVVQAKLLRVIEEREYQRLGGTRVLRADMRVIAATHRDLVARISRKEFREDLYYRLNVFQIHIPPLRERPEDIVPLAEALLGDLGHAMGRSSPVISPEGCDWLRSHHWPGNVRELRNAIERAMLLCDGGPITRQHFAGIPRNEAAPAPITSASHPSEPDGAADPGLNFGVVERSFLERALDQAMGNKSKAARLLGLSRSQLYTRLVKYGIAL